MKELRLHLVGNLLVREIVDVSVNEDQIFPAIPVGINELSAETKHRPTRFAQPHRAGAISECTRSQIDVERVGFVVKVGDKQVESSIIIGIARSDSHAGLSRA